MASRTGIINRKKVIVNMNVEHKHKCMFLESRAGLSFTVFPAHHPVPDIT